MREGLEETENRPLLDIYETCEGVVLEFDLPGFSVENISLKVYGLTLMLEAYKPREHNAGSLICMERSFGRFQQVVHIPCNIDPCCITAEYRSGVLRVVCPKMGERRVQIKEITIE